MHPNKAIVAVAAKIARIAWVIITNQVFSMTEGTLASHRASEQFARPERLMTKQWIGAA